MLLRIALLLVLVNAAAFVAFALDKQRARAGQHRISERVLLALALAGGTPGAFLARRIMRHKTSKEPFRTRLLVIACAQAAIVGALLAPAIRGMVSEALVRLR
jgi:uncharacterized membrane protein YsdA (DUF1294 family)